jgi:hypothetical protein
MQESEVDEMCSVHDELLAQAQALAADNKVSHTSILSVRGIHVLVIARHAVQPHMSMYTSVL